MVRRGVAALVVLAPLWACELLVDDGERVLASTDAGMRDGADDVSGQDGAASCLRACNATQAACVSSCHEHGPGACQNQCSETETSCAAGCASR